MGFIKTHKTSIAAAVVLILLYFFSRVLFLTNLPIFTDEAIYLRWAQIALRDHDWLFISLTDGKQPLFIWLVIGVMSLFKDPLFAGRIISVFAGLFTATGLFFLGRDLFKNIKIGFISSLIYVIYPFALIYDRMALYDSLVGAFWVWGIYIVFKFINKQKLSNAIVLGLLVGVSNLNKSNFFLTIFISPLVLLISTWKNMIVRKMIRPIALLMLSGIISFVIYSALRISPFFYIINQKNAVFIYPLSEWIHQPFQAVIGNMQALVVWLVSYTAIPLLILILISFLIDKKFIKEKIILLTWFVIPFVILAFLGRVIYPRYILFMALSLLPLCAYTIYSVKSVFKNVYVYLFVIFLVFIPLLKTDFYILSDVSKADIPFTDKFQYFVGWPAGNGINQSVDFFEKEAKKGPIFIGAGGTFGLLPMSYEIYLGQNSNIKTKGYWPIENSPPQELMELKKKENVYFVFYQPCPACKNIGDAPSSWGLTKIINFPKYQSNLTIYKF